MNAINNIPRDIAYHPDGKQSVHSPHSASILSQGPQSRGGKGGSCPPTFLADNVNLLNVLFIARMHTRVRACRRGRLHRSVADHRSFLLHVQCFRRYMIVCLTKETPKYICLCFIDSQAIYIIGFESVLIARPVRYMG